MRILAFLVTLAFLSPAFAAPFRTKAPYALLVDETSGRTLFEKNADFSMAPASTTKILTAEIVFSRLVAGQLKLDDMVTISAHAATEGDAKSGGSSMFLKAGDRVSVNELLQGLLTDSGNDAAIAFSEAIAGSEKAFAVIMNAHARAIGMRHSHFTNPWGRAGNRVTPRDMARLAAYVITTYPQYYKYFSEPELTYGGIKQKNRNPLLDMGADGLKTGHLNASGFGLVASAERGGHRVILVLNGLKSSAARASEGRRLLEYGLSAVGG
jgi:D-alanyl-D-alanine carboxypeptidase (penicillin-binding protein 5/6)